jgi:predicted dehydrogenase
MLAGALEIASQRQKSGKTPRGYADYREMLKEKDLEIVLVGSPDHWHALHGIAAIEAGADVYLQKPVSADVIEGEALLAAARKHGRVVQIGTQRKSTPHLIDVKKR